MKGEVSMLKGIFVFSATIIGAGILALPIAAANAGLFPTLLILVIVPVTYKLLERRKEASQMVQKN